jgi:DNA-binding CsgD family transcriptional regulator
MSISFLASAIMCSLFLVILLCLFFLYTRLTTDNSTTGIQGSALPLEVVKVDEYKHFIQLLSKRELEVVEAVLSGNFSYKELSNTLNISVNTVKTHLKNIYQTIGVSNVAALSSLFRGLLLVTPKSLLNHLKMRYNSTHRLR